MALKKQQKRIVIIAGPNGAGKTTFAREYLPKEIGFIQFVNADLIAEGLSPFKPEIVAFKAGRLMIREIDEHVRNELSFALETTLSGLRYARQIPQWQERDYRIELLFLSLPSVELAVSRVRNRVRQGGHPIPESVVHRRYVSGRSNFDKVYKSIVDAWILYDASGLIPVVIEKGKNE